MKKWPKGRAREFLLLNDLLIDCASLDSGNRVIEKMQRIVKAAKKLRDTNLDTGRDSFWHFLVALRSEDEAK